ncbi:LpqN/LpqT family lipoprotein [Candidatus Mycobacterium wuenschmannii]|uniref:LpqN/LpqT family lipoprotein n=1 Tax=Candidatus Mycobacterium wuenschmannii TaxID=3027808 RepID=A0ABY8VYA4_9MYCO|nr:LpqN/LpqT family lipoprotein [Candidatus Mycobacterium wuenschmannii]WIM88610.1 LpqN/LpqT family lipoprotein [Candidatus Mycobacterium wuenschmannii]
MKRTAISGAAVAILATSITLAGCGSSPSNSTAANNPSSASASAKPQPKVAPRLAPEGPNPTIAGYFKDAHITATPVHKGDPGAPTVNFPMPDGWADAGPDTPPTAYWAIVDNGPESAKYTPSIVATVSKLDGDVDPQKLIELAAGATKNLPGFKIHNDGTEDNLGGFPAYQLAGTWTQDGQTRAVLDKVVVINGKDDVIYLLELNADALPDQVEKAVPAAVAIDEKTTITP